MANVLEAIIRGRDELTGAVGSSLRSLDSIAGRVTALSTGFLALRQVGVDVVRTLGGVFKELEGFERTGRQLGITTDEVQRLSFAAGQAGATLEGFVTPVQMLQDRLPQLTQQLAALGLKAEDIKDRAPTDVLVKLAEAFEGVESQTVKTQLAMDLFGRSGRQVLADLAEGSKTLRENFERTPLVDAETIKRAERFGDIVEAIQLNLKAATINAFDFARVWQNIVSDPRAWGGRSGTIGKGEGPMFGPSLSDWDAYGKAMSQAATDAADEAQRRWAEFFRWAQGQAATFADRLGARNRARAGAGGVPGLSATGLPIMDYQPEIIQQVNAMAEAADNAAIRLQRSFESIPAAIKETWDQTLIEMEFSLAESIVYGEKWHDAMVAIINDFKVQIIAMLIDVARQALVTGFLKVLASIGVSIATGGVAPIGTPGVGGPGGMAAAPRVRIPQNAPMPEGASGIGLQITLIQQTILPTRTQVRSAAATILGAGRELGLA